MTWLVNRYFRIRTKIEAQFVGQGVHGRLTNVEDNKPLVNATIGGYIPGVDFSQPLPTTVIQGVVPPNADHALIGYRLKTL